ncbi:7c602392-9e84-413a-9200-e3bc4b041691 [Thermothielavioides terrestris]|nr:7c602392-9e84-413a-9200-e3bc4b041691 [Thermothielavioides terrestris]
MGKAKYIIRNHGIELDISDWTYENRKKFRRGKTFDEQDTKRAYLTEGDYFVVEAQLARLAINVKTSRAHFTKQRDTGLSIHQAAYKCYTANTDKFPLLRDTLAIIENSGALDDEGKTTMKEQATRLYKAFLDQFVGVITATPYTGCLSKFVRTFKVDVCLVDEATKLSKLDFCPVIRKHTLDFIVVVGDPEQLPAFVHGGRRKDKTVANPFENQLRVSTLERALYYGSVVGTHLRVNHRARRTLGELSSHSIYYNAIAPALRGAAAYPPPTQALHAFLKKLAPDLRKGYNRILVELLGVSAQLSSTSTYNLHNGRVALRILRLAFADKDLQQWNAEDRTVTIMASYRAQADWYRNEIRQMELKGLFTAQQLRRIDVRTTDNSQGIKSALVI